MNQSCFCKLMICRHPRLVRTPEYSSRRTLVTKSTSGDASNPPPRRRHAFKHIDLDAVPSFFDFQHAIQVRRLYRQFWRLSRQSSDARSFQATLRTEFRSTSSNNNTNNSQQQQLSEARRRLKDVTAMMSTSSSSTNHPSTNQNNNTSNWEDDTTTTTAEGSSPVWPWQQQTTPTDSGVVIEMKEQPSSNDEMPRRKPLPFPSKAI